MKWLPRNPVPPVTTMRVDGVTRGAGAGPLFEEAFIERRRVSRSPRCGVKGRPLTAVEAWATMRAHGNGVRGGCTWVDSLDASRCRAARGGASALRPARPWSDPEADRWRHRDALRAPARRRGIHPPRRVLPRGDACRQPDPPLLLSPPRAVRRFSPPMACSDLDQRPRRAGSPSHARAPGSVAPGSRVRHARENDWGTPLRRLLSDL